MSGISLLPIVTFFSRCILLCVSDVSVMRREAVVQGHILDLAADEKDGETDIAAYRAAPQDVRNASVPVLFFWSVSGNDKVQDLVKENVNHVRKHLKAADVFLAHYDLQKNAWLARDKAWYEKSVDFSVEQKGLKFNLARQLLIGNSRLNIDRYRWIWTLDEDIDFVGMDLARMLGIAEFSRALIVLPAFRQPKRKVVYQVQEPNPDCQYRYTPFLEMILPVFQAHVLKLFLTKCEHCLHDTSAWGSDKVMCHWSARATNTSRQTACAIIDETPVLHRDFQTIGKYDKKKQKGDVWKDQAQRDLKEVDQYHHDDFVSSKQINPLVQCVRRVL